MGRAAGSIEARPSATDGQAGGRRPGAAVLTFEATLAMAISSKSGILAIFGLSRIRQVNDPLPLFLVD
jgi:hypothetical protein